MSTPSAGIVNGVEYVCLWTSLSPPLQSIRRGLDNFVLIKIVFKLVYNVFPQLLYISCMLGTGLFK